MRWRRSRRFLGPRRAAYDLKKLRAKMIVRRIAQTRRYESTASGLRAMDATGGSVAASFVGLPEAPYTNILLAHVQISAQTGWSWRTASLTVDDVQVTAQPGPSSILEQEASVNPVYLRR